MIDFCRNNNKKKEEKNVTMVFRRDELLYDIANYSYVEADVMGDDNTHRQHQVFDIAQAGNVDRVTRVLNTAYAECVEMLYPYTKKEITDCDEHDPLIDSLHEKKHYDIALSLPTQFSITTVRLLKELIHEYLVCRVLADWFSITYPEKAPTWQEKYLSIRDKIRSAIMTRMTTTRLKLKPF